MKKDLDRLSEPDRKRYRVAFWVLVVSFTNFLIFDVITLFIGGDAINGKIENGHFYLFGYSIITGVKDYTEVSRAVYTYSKWHVYSCIATSPFIMAAALLRIKLKKRMTTQKKDEPADKEE